MKKTALVPRTKGEKRKIEEEDDGNKEDDGNVEREEGKGVNKTIL